VTTTAGRCHLCRREEARLSFEHVPPRAAFNEQPTRVYGLKEWLERSDDREVSGGRIEQRGAGRRSLCETCNNNTGSWYGNELNVAAASGARVLRELPLDEIDAMLDPMWADVKFRQSETGPHPLRFIKQVVTMLLATSGIEVSETHPELGDFVLDKERTGLDARYQFYLALYAGPNARSTGIAQRLDFDRGGRVDTMVEVAFPPYAYVMTIDSPPDALPTVNVTDCVNVGYSQRADMELQMLVGFGHTIFPADYRTNAMVERDYAENKRFAEEHGITTID